MVKKILKLLSSHSQITLIVSILLLILFSPFYWDSPFANYFNFLFLSLILLSSILTLKKSGFKFKRVQSIGYLILALTLLTAILHNDYLELVNKIVFVLFYILVAINLLVGIVKSKEVDSNVIFSAVAVYLLFGFCGALLAAVVHFFNPAAFSLESTYSSQFHQYLYFSFITFTTTGYGDVLPISPMARTLAIFLAVFGQIYLTVIIGILIGKYLSGSKKS
ncbi:MAG: two pore domain potassium channel family protein [Ignavibacteriaceae bacterium]|nr:two pore domain potassium channel family protein [Ignavibacteriaceae bacterium]